MKKQKKPRRNERKKPIRGSFRAHPPISGKNVTGDFDGDPVSSNGGAMLFTEADRRFGISSTLAGAIRDNRDQRRVKHKTVDIVRDRLTAIGSGYPDANDLEALQHDPSIRMAAGKDPFEGVGLASQPTVSRFENDVTWRDVVRASRSLVDLYCKSAYMQPPEFVILDIDTTFCPTYGEQEGACWSTHHDGHGYAPFHVYDIHTGALVGIALHPAKTPSGEEVLPYIRSLVRSIRRHWKNTQIILRGDSHFCRWEIMDWCDGREGVDYVLGLATNSALQGMEQVREADARARRKCGPEIGDWGRTHCDFLYGAESWKTTRRVVGRVLATRCEFMNRKDACFETDRRFVVTSLQTGLPEEIYETTYCMRAQAENLIKFQKKQMRGDRLSCSSALANQMRLILHSGAYVMMWAVRAAAAMNSEFGTVREKLIKVGACVRATATRIRVALSSSCPDQELFLEALARLRDKNFIDPANPPPPYALG